MTEAKIAKLAKLEVDRAQMLKFSWGVLFVTFVFRFILRNCVFILVTNLIVLWIRFLLSQVSFVVLISAVTITCFPVHDYRLYNHKTPSTTPEPNDYSRYPTSDVHEFSTRSISHRSKRSENFGQRYEQSDNSSPTLPAGFKRYFLSRDAYSGTPEKAESRRGLKIGFHMKLPTTKKTQAAEEEAKSRQDIIENVVRKLMNGSMGEELSSGSESEVGQALGILSNTASRRMIKPAYECDEWDSKYRICILERNIGDTVTFHISTGKTKIDPNMKVIWKKEYHIKDSPIRKDIIIDPENCPENIIIGNRGYELRVSPITEIDLGFNLFSASFEGESSALTRLLFMIRIVPTDLGFVYVGETIEINLRSFVSLPSDSLTFKWYIEKDGEHGTLPSNMKVTATGSSIKISELRQDQEGVLDCVVYTNRNFMATKKRFLFKDLEKNFDILKMKPDHNISFKESLEKRRSFAKRKRSKREEKSTFLAKALSESSITNDQFAAAETPKRRIFKRFDDDYNLDADLGVDPVATNQDDRYENKESMNVQPINDVQTPLLPSNQNLQSSDIFPTVVPQNQPESVDFSLQTNDRKSSLPKIGSPEFIANIDRFPKVRRVSAEEIVAKIISYCFNDADCSERAICIRDNVENPGFCKCLPGFSGVGIFCRENVWMNNGEFNIDRVNHQNPMAETTPLLTL